MNNYTISQVFKSDSKGQEQIKNLLESENLNLDRNLDYTAAIYDGEKIIATGSTFKNSLRCFAISKKYQGESLLNTLLSHLIEYQFNRGYSHLFVYTKPSSAKYFKDLGFHEIYEEPSLISFLENQPTGFDDYLEKLSKETLEKFSEIPNTKKQAAIVMNANPFTLGHLHLLKTACEANDIVHLFIVTDDSSLFPYNIRKQLILEGTKELKNIVYHDCDSYMVSSATFPAYFQKDDESVIKSQAELDVNIFVKIAKHLNITSRYVGDEPLSVVTNHYNQVMFKTLATSQINQVVISRISNDGTPISASLVREALKNDDWNLVKQMTPSSTYNFLQSAAALPIITKIKETANVKHY